MSQPTGSQLHIDVGLTQVSQKIPLGNMIGEKIFPVIKVKKDSDKIWIYGSEHQRIDDDSYVPGNIAKSFDWTITNSSAYSLNDYAREGKIVWAYRDNADDPIKYEQDTIQLIRENQMTIFENRVATKLATAGNFTTDTPARAKWDDFQSGQSASDPLADVDDMRTAIHNLIGLNANILKDFVDFTAVGALKEVGIRYTASAPKTTPIPWFSKHTNTSNKQTALQEQESTNYVIGIMTNDLDYNELPNL